MYSNKHTKRFTHVQYLNYITRTTQYTYMQTSVTKYTRKKTKELNKLVQNHFRFSYTFPVTCLKWKNPRKHQKSSSWNRKKIQALVNNTKLDKHFYLYPLVSKYMYIACENRNLKIYPIYYCLIHYFTTPDNELIENWIQEWLNIKIAVLRLQIVENNN